jgi:hypothetical protein
VQILADKDNINTTGRTLIVMMEYFSSSETESRKMGLIINKEKMKYMLGQTTSFLPPDRCINEYTNLKEWIALQTLVLQYLKKIILEHNYEDDYRK